MDQHPLRQGLSIAARMGAEMVAATVIGAFIGYLLDAWLGTRPWIMVVGLFLGGAAGIRNVYRMANTNINDQHTPRTPDA